MARRKPVPWVFDGDTFVASGRRRPIRLADVDTPENGQPGFTAARDELTRLLSGNSVEVDVVARDVFGRDVANVKAGGRSVNRAMRKHGK